MTQHSVDSETLNQARDAIQRHDWRLGFDLLSARDSAEPLSTEDLERLADAASWIGSLDESLQARERAYKGHIESGNKRRAAAAAMELGAWYQHKLAESVSAGWFRRAERLLEDEPESPEHGYLARRQAHQASAQGDVDQALDHISRMLAIGERFADLDLQALALHEQGMMLVAMGRVEEGMALLDEAAVAAVEGELGPDATATIYCNVISTCRNLADYRRAGEWTEAAKRWCERQALTGFPGHCRVFRAEIMRLRGAWLEAEQEALDACRELNGYSPMFTGEAFYELGEIRLRLGNLEGAEDAFRQAHELGCEPQPGLAMLRLSEGKRDAAVTMIRGALSDQTRDRLARARLLPAQVEVCLATEDLEPARAAVEELDAIAADYGSQALQASAYCARGALQLGEGDVGAARESLRNGWRLWQEVDAPYEAAKARVLLAQAYRAEGDAETAVLELEAAKSAFERLGALPDLVRTAQTLEEYSTTGTGDAPSPVRGTRTFMFTDICRSTNLIEAIGDDAWEDVLRWHDQTLRSLIGVHGGEEIKHGGDGFFVAFVETRAAVECAVSIQRKLVEHRRTQGFAPSVRIGLHAAEATRRGKDYGGKGVHQAARIGALADAGEILASHESVQALPDLALSEARLANLKGLSQPVSVVAIGWQ